MKMAERAQRKAQRSVRASLRRGLSRPFFQTDHTKDCVATEDGDEPSVSGLIGEPCVEAKSPGGRTASRDIRTNSTNISATLERAGAWTLDPPWSRGDLSRDCAAAAAEDPDASRSCAEPDNGGTAQRGLRAPCCSFGSAGQPRVGLGAEPPARSLRCNKSGLDHNRCRRAPAHGKPRIERSAPVLRP